LSRNSFGCVGDKSVRKTSFDESAKPKNSIAFDKDKILRRIRSSVAR
jgi:hypothetical protein